MEDIKKRISKLVDLKSIISIIMVAAMVAGFFGKMVAGMRNLDGMLAGCLINGHQL